MSGRTWSAAVLLLFTLGGCGMSVDSSSDSTTSSSSPGNATGSLVRDGKATLDFRSRPTRASTGMGSAAFISYPTKGSRTPVEATLRFPGGDVAGTFFEMDIGTNYAFGADPEPGHQPKYFDLYQQVADADAARTLLSQHAAALGLDSGDIAGITGEGTAVLRGVIDDWLSVQVQVRARDDGSLNVIYSVSVDVYHNSAVDQIVHDGSIDLDLTTRPSREALGFLPDYDDASVVPEPGTQLGLRIRTADGEADLPVDSLLSDAGSQDVESTVASATFADLDTARRVLAAAAGALTFDAAAARAFLDRPAGDVQYQELSCASTSVYTCALRLSSTDATGGRTSVGYRLTLTYR